MRKLTIFAAIAIMTLGVAGTAQAQHGNGNRGNGNHSAIQQRGGEHRGNEINRGGEFRNPGVNRDFHNDRGNYGRDYRGNFGRDYRGNYGRDYRGYYGNGWGRGGIDIYIGGGRYGYPNYGVPSTRIVYEVVQERVYDSYSGSWVFTGRTYNVSHVATWDNYYRGYVWYDSNGQLRVN